MFAMLWPLTMVWQSIDPDKLNGYLILGYGAMWAIAMGYLVYTANRQRNLREDIAALRQLLEEEGDSAESARS